MKGTQNCNDPLSLNHNGKPSLNLMYLFLDGSKSLELYSHLNPLVNVTDENDNFPKKPQRNYEMTCVFCI